MERELYEQTPLLKWHGNAAQSANAQSEHAEMAFRKAA
jgi:hypothetical protein